MYLLYIILVISNFVFSIANITFIEHNTNVLNIPVQYCYIIEKSILIYNNNLIDKNELITIVTKTYKKLIYNPDNFPTTYNSHTNFSASLDDIYTNYNTLCTNTNDKITFNNEKFEQELLHNRKIHKLLIITKDNTLFYAIVNLLIICAIIYYTQP